MTDEQKRLSQRYIIYCFLLSFFMVEAIWLYFYRLYMNDAQIGLLDAVAFSVGLLVEVPSGALADKIGRARTMKIGVVLASAGIGLQALGGFWLILIMQAMLMAGFALMSGADEALFFEKLKFSRDSTQWRQLIMRSVQAMAIAGFVAIPLGSWLYGVSPQLPFILCGLFFLLALIPIWHLQDEKSSKQKVKLITSFRDYGKDIASGFRAFAQLKLRLYVPLILTVWGSLYVFNWGLLKMILMDRFGFSETFGGIVLGSASLLMLIALQLVHKYSNKLHEKHVLSVLSLVVASSFILSVLHLPLGISVAIIISLYLADGISRPFLSEILHNHTTDRQRATVVSVGNFFKEAPYVILAPLIGWLNTIGRLDIFLLIWPVLIVLAWSYYFVKKKHDEVVTVDFAA
ncbi:MFS transporter [Candidatus Saccharibacteria bacterium]|nr:MFS transporter [Candidatus Saccharibacteria bacterium]